MLLTREQILAINDIQVIDVSIPEWGGIVKVKSMTGEERDKFELSTSGKKREHIRAKLLVLSVVGEDGKHLFTMEDVEQLSKKSSAPLDRILAVVKKVSGVDNDDVEELAKK